MPINAPFNLRTVASTCKMPHKDCVEEGDPAPHPLCARAAWRAREGRIAGRSPATCRICFSRGSSLLFRLGWTRLSPPPAGTSTPRPITGCASLTSAISGTRPCASTPPLWFVSCADFFRVLLQGGRDDGRMDAALSDVGSPRSIAPRLADHGWAVRCVGDGVLVGCVGRSHFLKRLSAAPAASSSPSSSSPPNLSVVDSR